MEIKKIRLQNFLSFGNSTQEIDFSKLSTIVGPNDSGKTNVFRAIELVANLMNDNQIPLAAYYHDKSFELFPKIEIDLKINDEENEMLINFFICSCLYETTLAQKNENENKAARKVLKKILDKKGKDIFSNFFDELTIIIDTDGRSNYPARWHIKIGKNKQSLFYQMHRFIRKPSLRGGSYSILRLEHIILEKAKTQFPEITNFITNNRGRIPEFQNFTLDLFAIIHDEDDQSRSVAPTGFQFNEYEANRESIPEFIRLRNFIRRMDAEKDGVDFAGMVSTLFKNSLIKIANLRSIPKSIMDPQDLFYEKEMLNLSGENLVKVLYSLSQNDDPSIKDRFHRITSEFNKLTGGLNLEMTFRPKTVEVSSREIVSLGDDISLNVNKSTNLGVVSRTKKVVRQEIGLQIIKKGTPIPIELTSAGTTELIILLTALIGQQNKVILLDEPAANFHPILQRKVLQIVEEAVQKNNNQVIVITHSPFLITPENFKHACKFSSSINGTKVLNIVHTMNSMDVDARTRLIVRLHRSDVREILFQHGVVMVEGPSDKIVLEKIDQYFTDNEITSGPNIEENEWVVLDVGGKQSLPMMLKLTQKLKISHTSVLDYDGLMQCDTKIWINGKEVKTSLVISCIDQTDTLTESEKELVLKLEKSLVTLPTKTHKSGGKQFWYDETSLDQLNRIAAKYNFYVLTKDLEGSLQSPTTSRDSKPLHALERINSLLHDNKIPVEIKSLLKFLKNEIKKQHNSQK